MQLLDVGVDLFHTLAIHAVQAAEPLGHHRLELVTRQSEPVSVAQHGGHLFFRLFPVVRLSFGGGPKCVLQVLELLMLTPGLFLHLEKVIELVDGLEEEDLLCVVLVCVLTIGVAAHEFSEEVLTDQHLDLYLSQIKILPGEGRRNGRLGLDGIGKCIR